MAFGCFGSGISGSITVIPRYGCPLSGHNGVIAYEGAWPSSESSVSFVKNAVTLLGEHHLSIGGASPMRIDPDFAHSDARFAQTSIGCSGAGCGGLSSRPQGREGYHAWSKMMFAIFPLRHSGMRDSQL